MEQAYTSLFMQITRTIYGSNLQTAQLQNKKYKILEHTTLNELWNVRANLEPKQNPTVQYIAIGSGGHRHQAGANGVSYTSPIRHRPSDAGMFRQEPFRLRLEGNDLTSDERSRFAIRVKQEINGRNYIGYYLMRIQDRNDDIILEHTTVKDGVAVTKPFVPTRANLEPKPPEIAPNETTTTNGDYLTVTHKLTISFSAIDVTEYINVAKIKYDNPYMAVISELALCSGEDATVTEAGAGENVTYAEAIGVQVASFVTVYYPVGYTNRGFDIEVELGSVEPMTGEGAYSVTKQLGEADTYVRE